jgi:hypothetical protein
MTKRITKLPKELLADRAERIRLHKCTTEKVVPDKTKYDRKKSKPIDLDESASL